MGISRPFRIYPTPTSLPRDRKSSEVNLPPPIGGWNTRDDPVSMGATDAIELINFYPTQDKVAVRKGFTEHSDVVPNTGVQTDSTNYLDAGYIVAFDFSSDFTVEFWIKHSGNLQVGQIVSNRDAGLRGWDTSITQGTGQVTLILKDSADGTYSSAITNACPNDGSWHHVAFVVDVTNDLIKPYLNGLPEATTDISASTADFSSGGADFRVFTESDGTTTQWADGLVDGVRVWSDVRTAVEILANYQTESPAGGNLIGHWLMNGVVGASVITVADESGSGNTLTDTGAGDITYVKNEDIIANDIDTIAEFFGGATRKLVAASSTNLYDATSTPATSLAGSFTSGQWQTAMMDGVMGLVNGADAPQTYDGSTVGAMTVSGPTVAELIGVHIFKARSYFWKADSPSFWYSAVNTLGGALTEFQLGEISEKGGSLLVMTSWTVDGGSGPDDYAVFIMDSGEVIVYQGNDPGSSADWALVGRYAIPTPMGRRAVANVGGEVAVLTDEDIVFMPSSFSRPTPPESKLAGAIRVAAPAYRTNFGWDLTVYKDRLLINIPVSASNFEQYVLNLNNGSPARFNGQNGRSWVVYDDGLYFGGDDGVVYQSDTTAADNGANINADAKQAWTALGNTNVQVEAMRTVWSALADFGGTVAFDYRNENPAREVSSGGTGTPWGSAWGSAWGSSLEVKDSWQGADGYGQVLSVQLAIGVNGNTPEWYRTDLLVSQAPNI